MGNGTWGMGHGEWDMGLGDMGLGDEGLRNMGLGDRIVSMQGVLKLLKHRGQLWRTFLVSNCVFF